MTIGRFAILISTGCLLACGGGAPAETTTPKRAGTVAEGEMLIEKGDHQGALEIFEGIAAKAPDNAKAQFYIGVCQRNLGDNDGAIRHYESAIKLDENLMDAHVNLGLLLLDTGDLDRAASELGIYLKANPDEAEAHFNYGLAEERRGNLDSAAEHYEKAMSLDPDDPSPVFGLGDVARAGGKLKKAMEWYEKARAIDPEVPELVYVEGQTLLEMKQPGKACETLSLLLDMSEVDLVVVSNAGQLIAKVDSDCAIKLYKGAIAVNESFPTAHFLLANTLARNDQFEEAKTHYERFLELAPDDPGADAARHRLEGCNKALQKQK